MQIKCIQWKRRCRRMHQCTSFDWCLIEEIPLTYKIYFMKFDFPVRNLYCFARKLHFLRYFNKWKMHTGNFQFSEMLLCNMQKKKVKISFSFFILKILNSAAVDFVKETSKNDSMINIMLKYWLSNRMKTYIYRHCLLQVVWHYKLSFLSFLLYSAFTGSGLIFVVGKLKASTDYFRN